MPASISMITLGVSDLVRSIAFYESIGFERDPFESDAIAFFKAGGPQLALFPLAELAKDAGVDLGGGGFGGVTLSQNLDTSREVDELISLAVASGATLVKAPESVFWGGYSGYFADPDGYLWEVACGSAEYAREKDSTGE